MVNIEVLTKDLNIHMVITILLKYLKVIENILIGEYIAIGVYILT